jgi:hypothetical protein
VGLVGIYDRDGRGESIFRVPARRPDSIDMERMGERKKVRDIGELMALCSLPGFKAWR